MVGAVLLLAVADAVWIVRGQKDDAIAAHERWVADSILSAISAQRAADTLRLRAELAQVQRDADSVRRAARHAITHADSSLATVKRLDSLLALATTAGDSLPLVVVQRDTAVMALASLRFSYDSTVTADSVSLKRQGFLSDSLRRVDRSLSEAREAALRQRNIEMALQIKRLEGRDKWVGFIPKPSRAVMLLLGLGAGYCAAKC